ncbi:MAG TPA: hypothetical protein PLR13_12235, partial [Smithella sp.]|nr:hypothetical protein [Smithella sp.]
MINKFNFNTDKKKLIIYILLVAVTFAAFVQINKHNFVDLDDFVYVTENVHVQSGITLASSRWALTTTYAEFWHPLTWL